MTIKLLYVATVATTCNAFLTPYAAHFREKGWVVDALARGADTDEYCKQNFDNTHNINWTRNPWNIASLKRAIAQVKTLITQEKYDLVHVHTPIAAFVTRYAVSKLESKIRPKTIYTAHGFHFYKGGNLITNSLFKRIELKASDWTDHLVTINDEDYQAAAKLRLAGNDAIHYIPGIGISLKEYQQPSDKTTLLQQLGLPKNSILILSVAEFTKNKRHEDQIIALQLLKNTDVNLLCAGMGSNKLKIEKLAKKLDVANQVHFLGHRQDIPRLVNSSDALVLTSIREGLPRSILEAFAAGVPVIATKNRGTADLLSGNCGLFIDVKSPFQLKDALKKITTDNNLRREIITNAATKVLRYRIENTIKAHEAIYEKALPNSTMGITLPNTDPQH